MIKKEWKSGPVRLKEPLRHCSKIVSARPARRMFITSCPDALSRFSKIPPITTSDQIAKEVEAMLVSSLINVSDQISIFNCYKSAFNLMIERFRKEGKSMKLVKDGYDGIISQLLDNDKQQNKQKLIRRRSVLNITALTEEEKSKANVKYDRISEKVRLITSIRDDLIAEIADLHKQVKFLKNTNLQMELSVGAKWNYLEEANEDLEIIETRKNAAECKLRKRNHKMGSLDSELDEKVKMTSDVLSRIYSLDKELRLSKVSIESLTGQLATIREREAETNRVLEELSSERDAIQCELDGLRHEVMLLEAESSQRAPRNRRASKDVQTGDHNFA